MAGVSARIEGGPELARFLETLSTPARDGVRSRVLATVARLVETDAKTVRIERNRGNRPPLLSRLTWRSGRLASSISTDETQLPRRAEVGTPVAYGPIHELGLTVRRPIGPSKSNRQRGRLSGRAVYPKRPFLQPALDFVIENKAETVFRNELERASAEARR